MNVKNVEEEMKKTRLLAYRKTHGLNVSQCWSSSTIEYHIIIVGQHLFIVVEEELRYLEIKIPLQVDFCGSGTLGLASFSILHNNELMC